VRRIAKILGVIAGVLVLVAAGLIAAGWYELRANGRRIREQYAASLAKVWPEFLEDQQLARTYPVLAPAPRARDAGPFLNARIGWDIDPKRLAAWRERLPGSVRSLTLDSALVDEIPKDWVKSPPSLWQQLDFSWMAALSPFDHWDVESNSPWTEEPHGSWPNGFPLLHELVPWAKLRLAKGVATRDFAGAESEVEHLGALLLSTETTLGASIGLQVLALVREAADSGEAANRTGTHAGIDAVTRAQAFRATMAAQAFLRDEAPETYRRDVERIVVGRCAALNEALRAALALRGAVGPGNGPVHWIRLDGGFASSCRLSLVRRAVAQGGAREDERHGVCDSAPAAIRSLCRLLAAIPGVRAADRAVGEEILTQMMLANSRPDAWYEAKKNDCAK
jgi:hypothetical protein